MRFPARDSQRKWGTIQDEAIVQPETISNNGCDRLVLVLVIEDENSGQLVTVLPATHPLPLADEAELFVEISPRTKKCLSFDGDQP